MRMADPLAVGVDVIVADRYLGSRGAARDATLWVLAVVAFLVLAPLAQQMLFADNGRELRERLFPLARLARELQVADAGIFHDFATGASRGLSRVRGVAQIRFHEMQLGPRLLQGVTAASYATTTVLELAHGLAPFARVFPGAALAMNGLVLLSHHPAGLHQLTEVPFGL